MKKFLCSLIFGCALPYMLTAASPSPEFLKGYLCSKLEDKFFSADFKIDVVDREIIIYSWPPNLYPEEIALYARGICTDYDVCLNNTHQVSSSAIIADQDNVNAIEAFEEGGLLPELNPFFPTMLAQPHILGYSAGYRSYDLIFKSTLPVSIGDQFSFYQFKLDSNAHLYVGLEACVWAFFEAKTKSLSLINADYFVSIPLTYIQDKFCARLRIYHQSSHLGDEFLLEHPKIDRVNPSMEVVDLSFAYEHFDGLVSFFGYSRVLRSDESFKVKPNCVFYGFNYFLNPVKIRVFNVEAVPYFSTYFTNDQNHNWNFDCSAAIGYQLEKSYGRKLRVYLEGHHGYSAEGQFARKKSKYLSVNLQYGY